LDSSDSVVWEKNYLLCGLFELSIESIWFSSQTSFVNVYFLVIDYKLYAYLFINLLITWFNLISVQHDIFGNSRAIVDMHDNYVYYSFDRLQYDK
jgi:hypothetical protein